MPGSYMASARLASVCCRTNSERVRRAPTFVEGIGHSRVCSGSVSRTPREKLGRADSQAGAWSTRAYIPGSRYNLRGAGTSHRGGAFRRRRTPGPRKRSGRSLPGLLSQPDRTRHRCRFHRGPMNRECAHRHLGSAPYPNARRNSMDRNSGDCSPERPRHGSLDGPRRGQARAAVPQVHTEGR